MLNEQHKASFKAIGTRVHNLMDYHVEHRPDMQLHQYFFLKDSRPFIYVNSRAHLAILTWYAMMREETKGDFPKGALHLGNNDVVDFDKLTGTHHTFFEGMLAGKILLEVEKGDMGSLYILGRTQDNPGFELAEDDGMPFYLPLMFEGGYVGLEQYELFNDQVGYTPFATSSTGEVSINVRETYKL